MGNENKRIVEIEGVKLEIDLSSAKVIENYKIGDNVRVLVKMYSDEYQVHAGVIIGFDDFEKLPTITVVYVELDYSGAEIKYAYINGQNKNEVELAPAYDIEDLRFKKSNVMNKIQTENDKKNEDIGDIERKREYFETHFSQFFLKEKEEATS